MRTLLGRRHARSGLFEPERPPPRLVLRFAILLSLTVSVASGLILFVVYEFAVSEAERAAARQANLVASTLLQREVRARDLTAPVAPIRRKELDRLFQSQLFAADVLLVSLVRDDGLVTYSTDHRRIGTRASSELAREAASGVIVSQASRTTADKGGTKTLETFAPVSSVDAGGAALIIQSYAPIHSAARRAQLRIGGLLELLLLALFLVSMPMLIRVTRRIKAQMNRIHRQAFYDELTGLPNRAHLFQRLDSAVVRATQEELTLAVLLVDLDRFREINDTLGNDFGDSLLRTTGERLRAAAGGDRLVARMGGDEFAVVGELSDESAANALAATLRSALESPVTVDGLPLALDATVGIAFFPQDGAAADALVKHAEVALYTAKESRQDVVVYTPAVDPHDIEQLRLVTALRTATAKDQLRLHYQPKIDLATGAIAGFEALVRWEHPSRGLLPPDAFIPIAERTGAIRHITRAVLARAVTQLQAWTEYDVSLWVNLTAIDLLDKELPKRLEERLRAYGVKPERLGVELTESTVMADPDQAQSILESIAATGVRLSIDDFGTGYSSLAYLKRLPVQELKIDRSFVSDMAISRHDLMIVEATIQLGHSLGLQVVAEGVETRETHQVLLGLRCDQAQGHLYAEPLPEPEATALIESGGIRTMTPGAKAVSGVALRLASGAG